MIALAREVFAARLPGGYVFLDLSRDAYSGLAAEDSERLCGLLGRAIEPEELKEEERALIDFLQEEEILSVGNDENEALKVACARERGGLTVCEWRPHLADLAHATGGSTFIEVLKAGWAILRAELLLRGGLKDLVREIKDQPMRPKTITLNSSEENQLAALLHAVEMARRWYPRKVDCLVGSGALVLLALWGGLECVLVIGVQKFPFYAHAWVEHAGRVVNDSSEVQRRLAPILVVSPGSAACRS
ncbi:MAG: lasso peptide biosynthesis B2 protein [Chthoniobacter sp.]|uniref:lasso peptide biosynthesis B2 protein n=1 Tax=Chthoniobacter sp. TaxID=2510640 RepID=UPI0032A4BF4D